ncbi:MAG: DUF1189 family protein [Ignavibacteria bacterium]|nr:DUF1189 family protein [Ignavibacteria bacterium]
MKNVFSYLIDSFYDKQFYHNVLTVKKNKCIRYLFLLAFLSSIPFSVQLFVSIQGLLKKDVPFIVSQVPPMEIINGVVTVSEKTPLQIKSPDGKIFCLIDPENENISISDEEEIPIILGKNAVIFQQSKNERRMFRLTSIRDLKIDQSIINHWISFYPIVYAIILIFFFLWNILTLLFITLLYSIVSVIISKLLKIEFRYPQLFALSVMASTAAVVLDILLSSFSIKISYLWFWKLLLSTYFIYFGIKSYSTINEEQNIMENEIII